MPRFFSGLFGGALLAAALIAGFNYSIDPLQAIRKSSSPSPRLFPDQRLQVPGLARNYAYDTVIIGTSMTDNFSLSRLNAADIRWNAIRLSIDGSTAWEQRKILELALRSNKVKRVIWGIQWDSFVAPVDGVRSGQAPFPGYLYGEDSWGLARKYLLNLSTLRQSAEALISTQGPSIEEYGVWRGMGRFGCDSVKRSYADASQRRRYRLRRESGDFVIDKSHITRSVQRNLTTVISSNPDVEFILFSPPFSIWFFDWLKEVDPDAFESFSDFRRVVTEVAAAFPNVRAFDFQADMNIVTNPDNYRDLTHYAGSVNDFMSDQFVREQSRAATSGKSNAVPMDSRGECRPGPTG